MRLLFLKWDSFGNEYILKAWESEGFECIIYDFPHKTEDTRGSESLASDIAKTILEKKIDIVFSFDYFVTVSIACKACKVKYISWTYDSPYIQLYSETLAYETNYAFIFDSAEYNRLKSLGINTIHYLPMCAPVDKYDTMIPTAEQAKKYRADVAMIGSMYTEKKHQLFRHFDNLDNYTRGYLDAVMEAQKNIYGASILEQSLTKDIVSNMQKVCPMIARGDGLETIEWVFANYFIARKLTSMERTEMITALSNAYDVALYTPEKTDNIKNVRNMGPVDYYTESPYAIKCAKINLNISLRSIISGIPLRAMDIMGCGGFLLTNYQSDFMDLFEPDKDFVYFESKEDLMNKVSYYLKHEDERISIAKSGYEKMKKYHDFTNRIKTIREIAGI